jgi:hypothetical protein
MPIWGNCKDAAPEPRLKAQIGFTNIVETRG